MAFSEARTLVGECACALEQGAQLQGFAPVHLEGVARTTVEFYTEHFWNSMHMNDHERWMLATGGSEAWAHGDLDHLVASQCWLGSGGPRILWWQFHFNFQSFERF